MKQEEKIRDQRIIEAFLQRDEDALRLVSEKYDAYLHTIAYHILADDEDCAECKNDAYLKLWNSIPPEQPKNFKAYLAKIIRNIAIDRYRARSRERRIPPERLESLAELEDCIPADFSVEKELDDRILKEAVRDFVESLSKRKKYIFVCRYYCNDSIKDIAGALNISGSMVFHELADIRKKLKEKLIQEDLWHER